MGDDSYIFYRVRSYSEVSEEQLRNRENLKQSEEMVSDGENCVLPGGGSEDSQNGDYAEERPEGETGLCKTQVGLVRKLLQTNQMEKKQAGAARKR